ncbi:MAG: redoxin domain-containing protein [Prevotella nigrescens]|jgi:antioxidant, ahpC/TSA family|uniref:TlpA disulfide reductase family protein n=1 Tax=Prevotella nigrescens TaxID=28133 RepID=UPI001BAB70B3|nr:TlpA disulfide reductase family protein [Prevotella nigrescens]QUB52531.1 AhpC/TSA family protein [Prevotella nigrescens]
MKNILKTIVASIFVVGITVLMSGCGKEMFHVEGAIGNAKDSILYFEHNGLTGFTTVDSVKLDAKGAFSFASDKVNNPEFYRLRIAGQIINIAIDSTETVKVDAKYPQMATDYSVNGSYENEKIKQLALKQINLQAQCQALYSEQPQAADSLVQQLIQAYKYDVSHNYIFKEPMKAYSYFALFQYIVVNNEARLIFNPAVDPEDNKVFGAVATSWDTYFPNSERGQNLHNITIKGMRDNRIAAANKQNIQIEAEETGVIDLPLRDNKGNMHHLTDLRGKVVLLDFHAFSLPDSPEYIMQMRELYDKYHAKGLEIYMVSLDENEHFWKESVATLPWINVYDNTGISEAYTSAATATPIIYLIDRSNTVVRNPAQIKNLPKEIEALL